MLQEHQSAMPSTQERRAMRRFYMRLPATVKMASLEDSQEIVTETQNVSARGIFFFLNQPASNTASSIVQGSLIEVTMTFPPSITLTDAVRVRFVARIVRVERPLPVSRMGIAAMIEEYEFLRSSPKPDDPLPAGEWKHGN